MTPELADLRARLPDVALRDQRRLRRRIEGARKVKDAASRQAIAAEIAADVDAAEQRIAHRRASVPKVSYPQELPVSRRKDDILAAVRDNQVVIVAGETGSGKTTQLPKICLELGRGVHGTIGHTQPRRLAARTVAERVSEELEVSLGGAVGYKVRFTDQVGDGTLVKQMTDGILLAELQQDRWLRQYDTLIIDEAHERSLNIDFILGYLKQLLPRRPDLKVIITSATIDPERFARHFGNPEDGAGNGTGKEVDAGAGAPAPMIEVSGRTYPVEVRYRPIAENDGSAGSTDRDQTQAVCDAVGELYAEGPGDVLVFCSGEREIRDTADALRAKNLADTEILPLYARLSAAEQNRVFQPYTSPNVRRRIVLATNVAETSLTVPGITYVIDPGTARISRYSHRTKVQRLPVEPISQASANQRKGRCGRVSEGICIRLYSEDDFASRSEFTDPEILRTNLASVILAMTAAGLGDIEDFPFIDPPDRRQIKAGFDLLHELNALDPAQQGVRQGRGNGLTQIGRRLAQLPIDPRLGRMVLEAEHNGCVHDVMVIAAALSIQDPRERPAEARQAADQYHARFADQNSDFAAYLNLWQHLRERQQALSSNQFRKLCAAEYLNYRRVREWQDLYNQLRQVAEDLGMPVNTGNTAPADSSRIHVSVLSGLLSHIGFKDAEKHEYHGARNTRFAIFPGSALFKKPPPWVMAAELVETSRLWGRINARIEPEWVEPLARHLVKREYSEPHWSKKRGAAMAYERVTLYGVPIVGRRKVNYGRIDPQLSRELFIRHALVGGEWETDHEFFHANRRLVADVEDLEHRARRRDIVVDDETLFDFYDRRIPRDVVSAAHFDSWWKKARKNDPDLLRFSASMLVNEGAGAVSQDDYPDHWDCGGVKLDLSYQFEPGSQSDGVTVHIPLPLLNQVHDHGLDWQVPGLRKELVTALIRSLPKELRRSFVPAPNYAKAVLERVEPRHEPLLQALERELGRMAGVAVPREAWQLDRVPDHLKVTFRVVGERDRALAEGKDLGALQRQLVPEMRATLSAAAHGVEQQGLTTWSVGTLPGTVRSERGGHGVQAYPALADEGDTVAVRLFETEAGQQRAMWQGTRRLLLRNVPSPAKSIQGRLSNTAKLALRHNPHGEVAALLDDCVTCAADALIAECGGPAWDEEGFAKLLTKLRGELNDTVAEIAETVQRILTAWHHIRERATELTSSATASALADIETQLASLIYPGFVAATGRRRLPDLLRYLQAVERRLDKLQEDPARDRERMLSIQRMQESYRQALDTLPGNESDEAAALREVGWMIEELRVSYFAQQLGTPYRVSEKRTLRALDELNA